MKYLRSLTGFTLFETIIIIMIIGVALVPLLISYEGLMGRVSQPVMSYRALNIARGMMDEIYMKPFEDPLAAPGSFGLEGTESPSGPRSGYNDADDYNGWQARPPQDHAGRPLNGFDNFEERVEIANVLSDDFNTDTEDGATVYKKVKISVSWAPDQLITVEGLKVRP